MERNDPRYQAYVEILKEELIPAMGCTEPIALAYAAAKAREVLGVLPDSVQLSTDLASALEGREVIVISIGAQGLRGLMEELRQVALEAINSVDARYSTDWSAIKGAVKGDLSNYLYKHTKRNPMILPVIMEI